MKLQDQRGVYSEGIHIGVFGITDSVDTWTAGERNLERSLACLGGDSCSVEARTPRFDAIVRCTAYAEVGAVYFNLDELIGTPKVTLDIDYQVCRGNKIGNAGRVEDRF